MAAFVCAALIIMQSLSLAAGIAGLAGSVQVNSAAVCLASFAVFFLLRRIVLFAQESLLDRYSQKQANQLRTHLLKQIFLEQGCTDNAASATKLTHAVSDEIPQVEAYLRLIPPKLFGIVGISIPLLIAVFVLDWVSGIILLVTIPVIGMFMVILGRQARTRAEVQYERYGKLSNYFIDTLRGLPILHSFGTTQRETTQIQNTSEHLRKASMKTIAIATLSGAFLDLTATLGIAGIAMMLAMRLLDGSLSLSLALAVLILAPEFYNPIRSFAGDFHASLDARNALTSLLSLLKNNTSGSLEQASAPPWQVDSYLTLQNIDLDYSNKSEHASRETGLHAITLELTGHEHVAIVGPSGAGKSSLISLLAGRAHPTSGAFAVNGAQLDSLQNTSWQSLLHFIPQHPWIFNGTLAENIAFYVPSASREEIFHAVEVVGLTDLAESLPEGIDTVIGEGARILSGGEAHRVALARAILDERPILIFDEPTAHLDIETELELKERILPLMEGKLVIFATHRLHWLDSMNRVIFLKDGRIAADMPRTEFCASVSSLESEDDT